MPQASPLSPVLSMGFANKLVRAALAAGLMMFALLANPARAQQLAATAPLMLAQTGKSAESGPVSARPGDKPRKPKARKPAKRSNSASAKTPPRAPASAQAVPTKPSTGTAAAAAAGTAGALAAPALFASGSDGALSMAAPGTGELAGTPPQPLTMQVGLYRCDLNRKVEIRSMAADRSSMVIAWLGREHMMTGIDTASGALRYENADAGLTFLIIVGKAMLLDSHKGQQLANDCRL